MAGVAPRSDGGTACRCAILSGPAGGIAGSRHRSRLLGEENFISSYMGATISDIAPLMRGEPTLTGDKWVAGLQVQVWKLETDNLGGVGGFTAHADLGGTGDVWLKKRRIRLRPSRATGRVARS